MQTYLQFLIFQMTKEDLRAFRESKSLTQAQFAQYVGLKREKTISDYERGKDPVPDWLVSRIELEKRMPEGK